jgi:hypothetical protein
VGHHAGMKLNRGWKSNERKNKISIPGKWVIMQEWWVTIKENGGSSYSGIYNINRIKNDRKLFQIDNQNYIVRYTTISGTDKPITVTAKYLTVHKAKGLEADIVILINCNAGKHGFPSGMSDDRVLNLLFKRI